MTQPAPNTTLTEADILCAVVVTFHPDTDVLENLAALRPQVQKLVVVDNGSSSNELFPLRSAAAAMDFELLENNDNLGIATALNQGVRRALALGSNWIILFDQDSQVTPNFTSAMLHGFTTSRHGDRLGILVPHYTDLRHGGTIPQDRLPSGTLDAAMTSGSLSRASTFQKHGLFVDDLFIDCVDSEFSLRLRRAGFIIDECPEAILLHSPGTPRRHILFGRPLFQTTNYGPIRRYYQARNGIWMSKHYLRDFPHYCLRLGSYVAKDVIKILIAEDDKLRKLAAILRGLRDGLLNRMGKLRAS